MKDIVIIHHGDCSDGFGGAYAAWKKFKDNADYFGVQHHDPVIEGLVGKTIYFIDFVYKPEVITELVKNNKRVVVIDHHVTGLDAGKLAHEYIYDVKNSGCVLAWQYFHPKKKVPKMLAYIEDIDLWKFAVPKSYEMFTYMQTQPFNFKTWDNVIKKVENAKKRRLMIEMGIAITKFENRWTSFMINKVAELVEFEGYKVYAVNSPIFMSQVGSTLVKKLPPLSIIWAEREGKITVSLRSDGTADCAKIAEKYGGGGHKVSAGFFLQADQPKPWKRITE